MPTVVLIFAFFTAAFSAAAQCRVPVWADEFDGTAVDSTKWSFQKGAGGWGNQELENYTDREDNAAVRDGKLVITALREDFGGARFTSARMRTIGKGDWRYGRFEARMRLPVSQGMWPAFWMMPTDSLYGGWPFSGEIDIMELIGKLPSRVYGTLHTVDAQGRHVSFGKQIDLPAGTFADDFHIFALEWDPGEMRIYLDDQPYAIQRAPLPGGATWPYDQPFHIILNLAVGGQWPGSPDDTTVFPQTLEVDWVRVWQKPEDIQIAGPTLVEPGSSQVAYKLPLIPDTTYQWSVPEGASFDGGADSNTVAVNWAGAGGDLQVHLTSPCGDTDLRLPVTVSTNLWRNPAFNDGLRFWSTRVAHSGQAAFGVTDEAPDGFAKAATITIAQKGSNPWDVQLTRPGVPLTEGQRYRLTFWARSASGPRTVTAAFIDSGTYAVFATSDFAIDSAWAQYTYEFQASKNASAQMNLDLAGDTGTCAFTGFTFERIPN